MQLYRSWHRHGAEKLVWSSEWNGLPPLPHARQSGRHIPRLNLGDTVPRVLQVQERSLNRLLLHSHDSELHLIVI